MYLIYISTCYIKIQKESNGISSVCYTYSALNSLHKMIKIIQSAQ